MYRFALTALAASLALSAGTASAQQPQSQPAPPLIDWDKIQIKTTDLGNKTYMLEGQGRNAQLTHVTNAHTDGDTWVYFADANVLATGDTSNNTRRYQTIDFANGGDIRGMIAANEAYLKASNDDTKIVVGHGPLAKKSDV